jgi:hypothetical protein
MQNGLRLAAFMPGVKTKQQLIFTLQARNHLDGCGSNVDANQIARFAVASTHD